MKITRLLPFALVFLLAACGGGDAPPVVNPPTNPAVPEPIIPVPTPTPDPLPNPPTDSDVPYYGEWIVTYTSEYGVSFVHALQVTTDVSTEGLQNAGGGLQEFCTGGSGDECEGEYGSGLGFIGNLVLDDGTAPLTLAIATSYDGETPEVKLLTLDDIQMQTNSEGRQTFTVTAGWQLSTGDLDFGSITATNVGSPRSLSPLAVKDLPRRISSLAELTRSLRR